MQYCHYCWSCCCWHCYVVVVVISILVAHIPSENIMNFSLLHFFTIFMKWIIHVFSYNFLTKKDRKACKVASERSFQELFKQPTFFLKFNNIWPSYDVRNLMYCFDRGSQTTTNIQQVIVFLRFSSQKSSPWG